MMERLRQVLDHLGYPIGGAELLDVLWLARVMAGSQTSGLGAVQEPADTWDTGLVIGDEPTDTDDDEALTPELSSKSTNRSSGAATESQPAGTRYALFPAGGTADAAQGRTARAIRVPGPRALPGARSLARSLRPLREHREHLYRTVADVDATVRLTAESGILDVVLRPVRELRNAAVLLVDDTPSMQVWRTLIVEVGRLLERSGIFRTVHVRRFDPRELHHRHRTHGAGSSVTFILTDGVHPAWRSPVLGRTVAAWGRSGPVAVLNPLPQRLWRYTAFQPLPHLLRAHQRFPLTEDVLMLDPLTGKSTELTSDQLPLPIVSLSPSSLASWAKLLTRPGTPQLVETAVLGSLGTETWNVAQAREGLLPDQLIAAFRGSFSPQAYRLAVRLSAIRPLSPLLMQLVRITTLPEGTSAHVAEVLLGGLLQPVTDDEHELQQLPGVGLGDAYDFRPGVRELLSTGLSRQQSQEVVEAVGRALTPYLGRLPDFPALMADATGSIRLSEGASPFAVLVDPALERTRDIRPPGSSTVPAEVRALPAASGNFLLRASAEAVAAQCLTGSLRLRLTEQFMHAHGYRPSASQTRYWERSIPALANTLTEAGLGDVEVILEFALPLSSKRADAVLAGVHPVTGEPSYVVVELKQWLQATPDEDDPALCHVDAYKHPVLNPIEQVRRYCQYLVNFNAAVAERPHRVHGVAYLHNATEFEASRLRAIELDEQGQLFTAEHRREFLDYLRSKLSDKHPGVRAADELLAGKTLPSKQLMSVAAKEVRQRRQFVLLDQQQVAYRTVLNAVEKAKHSDHKEVVVVTGGPGTGKSAIALQLLGELYRRGVPALHATGSQPFTKTMRKVAGERKREVQDLFKYFNSFMTAEKNSLGALICDEAHSIRETSANRYTRAEHLTGKAQVDELIDVAYVPVFLLDEHQVVRPGEMGTVAEIMAAAARRGLRCTVVPLDSQFRSGSDAFLRWVVRLLGLEPGGPVAWDPDDRMHLLVADSPRKMEAFLETRRADGYSARMSAGYCWPWSPEPKPGDPLPADVVIGDWARPWNLRGDRTISGAPPSALWATDPAGFSQVGCVYTAQGFEYDWSGVIIGPDLIWRGDRWITDRTASRDPVFKRTTSDEDVDRLIRNTYKVLLTRGMVGTVIYSTDAETRAKLLELGVSSLEPFGSTEAVLAP